MSLDEQDFNISEDYPLFITPNYKNDIEDFTFNSEKEFDQWFQENIRKHGKFCYHGQYNHKVDKSLVGLPVFLPVKTLSYTCAHGYRRKKEEPAEETETALKKRKLTRKSIKVGCTAKYSKIYICNGQIKVKYNWKHVNHDPTDPREIIQSRLPTEIREWIEKKVTEGLDWKAIKSLLPARPLSLEQVIFFFIYIV
jgi:hypothetical protein